MGVKVMRDPGREDDTHACVPPTHFTSTYMNGCIKMVILQFYCVQLLYYLPLSRLPVVSLHLIPFPCPLLLPTHSPSFSCD